MERGTRPRGNASGIVAAWHCAPAKVIRQIAQPASALADCIIASCRVSTAIKLTNRVSTDFDRLLSLKIRVSTAIKLTDWAGAADAQELELR